MWAVRGSVPYWVPSELGVVKANMWKLDDVFATCYYYPLDLYLARKEKDLTAITNLSNVTNTGDPALGSQEIPAKFLMNIGEMDVPQLRTDSLSYDLLFCKSLGQFRYNQPTYASSSPKTSTSGLWNFVRPAKKRPKQELFTPPENYHKYNATAEVVAKSESAFKPFLRDHLRKLSFSASPVPVAPLVQYSKKENPL